MCYFWTFYKEDNITFWDQNMSGNKSLAKEELKKLTDEELENDMNFVVIHGLKLKGAQDLHTFNFKSRASSL